MNRDNVMTALKDLPKEFTFEELLDRLLLIEKIEKGIEESRQGKVYSTDEAREKLKKWLK